MFWHIQQKVGISIFLSTTNKWFNIIYYILNCATIFELIKTYLKRLLIPGFGFSNMRPRRPISIFMVISKLNILTLCRTTFMPSIKSLCNSYFPLQKYIYIIIIYNVSIRTKARLICSFICEILWRYWTNWKNSFCVHNNFVVMLLRICYDTWSAQRGLRNANCLRDSNKYTKLLQWTSSIITAS